MDPVRASLRRLNIFEGISESEWRHLMEHSRERSYRPHHYIFRAGQKGSALFVIISGHVKIENDDPVSGRRITLAILSEGECFGEIAVINSTGRTAAAVAMNKVEALELPEKSFLQLLRQCPSIGRNLICSLAKKLSDANHLIDSLTFKNLGGRLAGKLLELSHRFGEKRADGAIRIAFPFSQEELASLVGTNRETVTRLLGDFKREGSVEVKRREVAITDAKLLKAWIV